MAKIAQLASSGGSTSSSGSLSGSVISRAPRSNVKYDHAHWIITTSRLRKPIRKRMWTNSQSSQAKNPEVLNRPILATAAPRPIVASIPLST